MTITPEHLAELDFPTPTPDDLAREAHREIAKITWVAEEEQEREAEATAEAKREIDRQIAVRRWELMRELGVYVPTYVLAPDLHDPAPVLYDRNLQYERDFLTWLNAHQERDYGYDYCTPSRGMMLTHRRPPRTTTGKVAIAFAVISVLTAVLAVLL